MSKENKRGLPREVFVRVLGLLEEIETELERAARAEFLDKEMDSFSKVILELDDICSSQDSLTGISDCVFGKNTVKGKTLIQVSKAYVENNGEGLRKFLDTMQNPVEFAMMGSQVLQAIKILRDTPINPPEY